MKIRIKVPGSFSATESFVDVETAKVPTPLGYTMPNGEPLSRRWRVIAAGAATGGEIVLVHDESEVKLLNGFGKELLIERPIVYSATREFDEMSLKGRFTYVRRAHLPEATWPAMPYAEKYDWRNGKNAVRLRRMASDCASKDVPDLWAKGNQEAVLVHLLRDVAELIVRFGEPNKECRWWCTRVLLESDDERYPGGFAERVLSYARR